MSVVPPSAPSASASTSGSTSTAPNIPSSTSTGSATPSTAVYNTDPTSASSAPTSTVNGGSESSKLHPNGNGDSNGADPTFHALSLASWTYNVGYLHQDWADVHLTFFSSGLKAHRLILARSSYLARLMRDVAPGSTIHLSFQDENITEESVHIALQYLYNPSQHLVNPQNARSVLSTSYLFGAMPDLTHLAYTMIRSSLDSTNIVEHVQWLSASPVSDQFRNGTMYGSVQVSSDGNGQASGARELSHGWDESEGRYGEWTIRLKQDVLEYLLRILPTQITSSGSSLTADPRLLSTYTSLPYDLFKRLIESKELPISSMQDRFAFAKKVIAARKKLSSSSANPGPGGGGQMEESVVLAFKGGDGMEVHVTRKPKKSRALWKVEG